MLEGALTLHVCKSIRLDIDAPMPMPNTATFTARASTTIDRTEFGIDVMTLIGGSSFSLVVEVTATRD